MVCSACLRPSGVRVIPTLCHMVSRIVRRVWASLRLSVGVMRCHLDLVKRGRRPKLGVFLICGSICEEKTRASSSELEANRLAPCTPVQATSPKA